MLDWFKAIDPTVVVSTAIGVLGWLYHKARGDKTESARAVLQSLVRQVLFSDGVDLDNVRSRFEALAKTALAKRGFKGAIVDALIHEFSEYAAAELAERLDLYQSQLDQLDKVAAGVNETLKPVREPTTVVTLGPPP